ncbi:uncharacterized protein LOC125947894 isoform X4 [Anopheles darlingi]|uniref:uncharacterized protein LOC125947894 isoform X4 n=1 Tax=Anopheles darlingi TaxID=43151 RepID=UPI002100049B|nr:uncharacterized protein LOC125947894 isoform X4 [Anopheles darlingi]
MTSILSAPGKYRSRKDISTGSIPTLVSLDEESSLSTTTTTSVSSDTVLLHGLRASSGRSIGPEPSAIHSSSSLNIKNGLATKPPRRSSLGFALLGGGSRGSPSSGTDKSNKRRSSIADVFLGRRDSRSSSTSSLATGIGSPTGSHHHHHHNGHTISTIPEKYIKTSESDIENDAPNTDQFAMAPSPSMLPPSGDGSNGYQDPYGTAGPGSGGYDKKRRRSSSWQTKLERRRRKGMMAATLDGAEGSAPQESSPAGAGSFSSFGSANGIDSTAYGGGKYGREKRHSWWNIFVPDNLKQRTRRASQDVILSKSSDTLSSPPYRRSKSRSVDHGLAAPFDLDSLRSKVEGRFESIDRLSKDGEKKRSMQTIPTVTYTVKDRDTLTSVAARFDTTPSELTQLNRLASSFIYSGQQLLVPDKNAKTSVDGESDASTERSSNSPTDGRRKGSQEDLSQDEKDLLEGLRPGSPKPGHIERVASPNTQGGGGSGGGGGGAGHGSASGTGADDDDPVTIQRFLKINVRHITDGQGVVGGVLLVTPNAVMFDPNVSDPLVIEHGPESYGVIAPMEFIVNAAIFNDIAHMRVQGASGAALGGNETAEKAEIYHPVPEKPCSRCDTHSPGKDSLLVKDETFPELGVGSVEGCDDQESICSSNNERDGDAFPKAFERDLVTPNNLQRLHGDSTESGGSSEPKPLSSAGDPASSLFLAYDRDAQSDGSKVGGDKTDQSKSNLEDPTMRSLEERRRSLLDQHWAIPSKDRLKCNCDQSSSRRSLDDEEAASTGSGTTAASTSSTVGASSIGGGAGGIHPGVIPPIAEVGDGQLVKQSCHDSGIDIRDPMGAGAAAAAAAAGASQAAGPLPIVAPIATKKVYSDADIVLSADWVPPLTIAPTHLHDSSPRSSSSLGSSHPSCQSTLSTAGASEIGGRKKTSSVSFSVEEHDPHGVASAGATAGPFEKGAETKKNKMLKRLSYPLAWVEGLTGEGGSSHKSDSIESAPNTGDSNQSVFSKVFSRRSSIGTFIRQHPSEGSAAKQKQPPPKLDYRSMVSIDDMPTLFVSFDMKAPLFPQLEKLELIPRPARACPDPPMYLRLRMGRKIGKNTPLPTTVMSYGKNKLRPEYWFSIPKNKVDELYRFLNAWVQHLYGELDEAAIKERGFELIQIDTEWTAKSGSPSKDGRSASEGEISEYTRESWEVLSMSTDDYRKATLFASSSFDQDFQIPDLIGQTEILSEEHREKLCAHLPARAEGYSWSLVFSTSLHGFSLNSLYRKMHKLESPILIVIEDTEHNVFGALTSCSLHVSDHFYGTGESLLYKFNPHFKVFHWSGENLYFIKGNPESLAIGAGDGKFGLWLDGDLNQGRSQHCSTYSNEPLAPQEDFVIKTLECWAFV